MSARLFEFSNAYTPIMILVDKKGTHLLRFYSGECLGSSRDEERSELRYSIWIAGFRELLDFWTHAAFWIKHQFAVLSVSTIPFWHRNCTFPWACSLAQRWCAGVWNFSGLCSPSKNSLIYCSMQDMTTLEETLMSVRVTFRYLCFVVKLEFDNDLIWLKLPSEFKHISKWWKRNDQVFF